MTALLPFVVGFALASSVVRMVVDITQQNYATALWVFLNTGAWVIVCFLLAGPR